MPQGWHDRHLPQRNMESAMKLPPMAVLAAALLLPQPAPGQTSTFAATGRIESAGGTMAIGSAASGTIKEVLVHPWSRVHAGDVLLALDCRPLEAELAARQAQLGAAEAVFERVRNGPRPGEIAVAESAVGYSRARAEEAQKVLDRTLALHEGVSVTTARILEVQRDARISAAYLAEAREACAPARRIARGGRARGAQPQDERGGRAR